MRRSGADDAGDDLDDDSALGCEAACSCCNASSYFAQRGRSTVLLLGSITAYSFARAAMLLIMGLDHGLGMTLLVFSLITDVPAVLFMLTQTAFQPLYGRISDLVGRKVRTREALV